MHKISVIIPHYPVNQGIDGLLKKCVSSLIGHTELIIVVNEGTGFGKAVNKGMELSSGDYIVIVNNDVTLEYGSLQDIVSLNSVMSPMWGYKNSQAVGYDFLPSFFCLPRWVYEKIGGFDEKFKVGDYEDDDFYERCKEIGIEFDNALNVRVCGEQGATKNLIPNFSDVSKENRNIFVKKWNREPVKRFIKQTLGKIE